MVEGTVSEPTPNVARLKPVIAIDGPAGAGKSTLAAHLARRFGFLNLETGAMYRALALKAIDHDLVFDEEDTLLALAVPGEGGALTGVVALPRVDAPACCADPGEFWCGR